MQKNKMPVPTEAQEQMTLFSWAAMQSGKYPELNLLYFDGVIEREQQERLERRKKLLKIKLMTEV